MTAASPGDRHGHGVVTRRVVSLPSAPVSAGLSRRVLREVLGGTDREGWLEAAELACTELVSNAVLHARTEIVLTVEVDAEQLRVEVADLSPVLPLMRSYQAQASTGRGMALVAALTSDHGVNQTGLHGKTVWFTLRGDSAERSEQDLLAAWDDATWDDAAWDDAPPGDEDEGLGEIPVAGAPVRAARERGDTRASAAGSPAAGPGDVTVQLLGLPPALWLAAREHHDALVRELVLHLAEHAGPAVDLPAADRARASLSAAVLAAVQPGGASDTGVSGRGGRVGGRLVLPAAIDVSLTVPAGLVAGFGSLQDVLDVAERLAASGQLLVRPGLPEIVAVRDWACEQVLAQHAGGPAARWPGADQDRFDTVGGGRPGRPVDRRVDAVRDADGRVAAADDGNRILAVSRSLAELLGWDPAELVGRRIVALVPARLREQHVAAFTQHVVTGQGHVLGEELALPVLRADGTEIACRVLLEHDATGGSSLYRAWIDPATTDET